MVSVAMLVFVGVVLINGVGRRVGNSLAIASFIVAVAGMFILIL